MTSNSSLAFDTNSKTKPINIVDPTKLLNIHNEFQSNSFVEKNTEKAKRDLSWLRKKLINNSDQDDLSNHLNLNDNIIFQSKNNFVNKYYNSLKNTNQNMDTR